MSTTTRALLKTNFGTTQKPTGSQFADFIDTAIDGVSVTYTSKLVNGAGGGDYTTIKAAIDALAATATESNQYIVQIAPGTYTENGANLGINCHDYIHLRGWNRDTCIVIGGGASNKSPIAIGAKCTVSNLTLYSQNSGDYAVHVDNVANNGFVLANCRLKVDYNHNVLGIGGTPGTEVWFIDCEMLGNVGLHGTDTGRTWGSPWKMHFWGCTMRAFVAQDTLEYQRNEIDIAGCRIGQIQLNSSSTDYDNNPGDILYNQGAHSQSIFFSESGANMIGNVIRSGTDVVVPVLGSIHEVCSNDGGGDIAAGEAVKVLTQAWSTSSQTSIAKYNGSGIPYGFAPDAITNGSLGTIQRRGFPIVYADATGTAISYGDALELDSSGHVVKLASGRLVGYAREAKASGTGTIEIQLANGGL